MKKAISLKKESEIRSKEWIKKAKHDLATAEKMIEAGAYDWSTFLCQQSLEKLLKALFIREKQKFPPHVHHLDELSNLLARKVSPKITEKLKLIDRFYLPSRYPEERLSEQKWEKFFTEKFAKNLLKDTKEVFLWYSQENNLKK